ncbi:MAG: Eco57I restriction-modification methylase domain-containing protein, partial [Paludibacteraceae bacterium]
MDAQFLRGAYSRNDLARFLEDFLPDDFIPEVKSLNPAESYTPKFITTVTRLGKCPSLELEVFEVHHSSLHDARVGISRDAFQLLQHCSMCNRALMAFVPTSGEQWRFSLLEMTAEVNDATLRINRSYSNPRRFSFLLGTEAKTKTPEQYLVGKGKIRTRTENSKSLSPWEDLKSRFSVEVLTKEFYNELFNWYQWAVDDKSGIYFPNFTDTEVDDFEDKDKKIIRLITRLMFVWFIKQKNLVPDSLFDEKRLQHILVDFNPTATDNGNYYNAILQNLFFATLNRAIEDEEGKRGFAKLQGQKDVKTLYRYQEMFCLSEKEILKLFAEVPFLNGGLFECLDKTKQIDGVEKAYNYDGFSRNDKRFSNGRYRYRAFIPNVLFFDEEKGLINILKRYNFTIEENTPSDQTVALDPELLGKVFENLLGAYNPETRETARNQSGSFYTPREIVTYMVDESLKAYLLQAQEIDPEWLNALLADDFEYNEDDEEKYQIVSSKLKSVKILDPACGSGAFPMGLLNRMVDILQKIEPQQDVYALKLQIIENCIYGSDIQSIASQISKLRFFISLICDCEKDPSKPNFGIPTLPNLETKFVTANSLIGLHKNKENTQLNVFADCLDSPINTMKQQLYDVRHKHFRAKTAREKKALRKQDEQLREKLLHSLDQDDMFTPKDAQQMASWNPYDQNAVAPFFDPEWMFGVSDGFDIVIGNPPYIQLQNNGGELATMYAPCEFDTFARTGDIYCLFYEKGNKLLHDGGHLCYITSNKWMRAGYGEKTREFFANKTNPKLLIDFAGVKIFESATVDTNILLFQKAKNTHSTTCCVTKKLDKEGVKNLSDFVLQNSTQCAFASSD